MEYINFIFWFMGIGVFVITIIFIFGELALAIYDLIVRFIRHVKRWNKWRKGCINSKFHKFMVLLGIHNSPTMNFICTNDEIEKIRQKTSDLLQEENKDEEYKES